MIRNLTLCLLAIALASCGDDITKPPNGTGKVEVYVFWNEAGVPDKQIEIVETGDSGMTDWQGLILFDLPVGTYTVRAHGIGTPGPGRPYVDNAATVLRGETARVEVYDCQFCRAPARLEIR